MFQSASRKHFLDLEEGNKLLDGTMKTDQKEDSDRADDAIGLGSSPGVPQREGLSQDRKELLKKWFTGIVESQDVRRKVRAKLIRECKETIKLHGAANKKKRGDG